MSGQDPQSASEQEEAIARSLRLRARPEPVVRVSRRMLIVSGALLAAGVAGAMGWSLIDHVKPVAQEAFSPAPPPPEALQALPRDYLSRRVAPRLGPPLPGDLGRPILGARRDRAAAGALESSRLPALPGDVGPNPDRTTGPGPGPAISQASRQSARRSGLFVTTARVATDPPLAQGVTPPPGLAPGGDARTTSLERLAAPASPYILQAGSIVPAALVTGLASDAPGLAIAQVSQDVRDSLGGGHLLIPAGSRLIGDYDTAIADGQSRLRVAWTRLILPNGRSIVLDRLPGADAQGIAGLRDAVDRHGGQVLAAAALSTLLAIGGESGASRQETDLAQAVRRGTSQAVTDVGRQAVGRGLALAPTLTIRPGAPLRVLLTRDLVLEPYGDVRP